MASAKLSICCFTTGDIFLAFEFVLAEILYGVISFVLVLIPFITPFDIMMFALAESKTGSVAHVDDAVLFLKLG